VRARFALIALVVLGVAAVCVRLGFWQIARLHEKRALNAALRGAMQRPPVDVADARLRPPNGGRVRLRGRFDETRHVLLAGRAHRGTPGVHVVTPLLVRGGAVLVDRGWLPAADAATARPQDFPEPGEREVVGIASGFPPRSGRDFLRVLESDSVTVLSALRLDREALASRLPYVLTPFVVRQLPGPGVPERPVREPPHPHDETMHLSYAVQWFTFAAILLVGSAVVAWKRRPA
jgi:surfeit locus 1 family protein